MVDKKSIGIGVVSTVVTLAIATVTFVWKFEDRYAHAEDMQKTVEQQLKAFEGLNETIEKNRQASRLEILKLQIEILDRELHRLEEAGEQNTQGYHKLRLERDMAWAEYEALL